MKRVKFTITLLFLGLISVGRAQEEEINQAIDLFNKAAASFGENKYDEAIEQANKAYALVANVQEGAEGVKDNYEKTISQMYYAKATSQVMEKDFDGALETLKKTSELAEKYSSQEVQGQIKDLMPQIYFAKAASNFSDKNFDEAIVNGEKAIELGASDSKVYLILGMSYLQKENNSKAEEFLIKTAEVAKAAGEEGDAKTANGQLSNIYLKKAVAAQKNKNWNEVIANANKSIEYSPTNNGYKLKGVAALSLSKWDDAIEAWSQLLNDPKDRSAANYQLGVAYLNKKNNAKACSHFKAVGADPTYKGPAEQQIKAAKCN